MFDIKQGIVPSTETGKIDEIVSTETLRLVPTFVLLSVIFVLGSVGNGLVFYIYKTRYQISNTRINVLFMSTVDFFVCFLAVPVHLVTMPEQYRLYTPVLCKGSGFLDAAGTVSTSIMLILIAFERYKKVCKPFTRQMRLVKVRRLCIVSIVTGILIAVPNLFIYGQRTVILKRYGLPLIECSIDGGLRHPVLPLITVLVFGMIFLTTFLSIVIFYGLSIRSIYNHARRYKTSGPVHGYPKQQDLVYPPSRLEDNNSRQTKWSIQRSSDGNIPFLYKITFGKRPAHPPVCTSQQADRTAPVHVTIHPDDSCNTLPRVTHQRRATTGDLHKTAVELVRKSSEPNLIGRQANVPNDPYSTYTGTQSSTTGNLRSAVSLSSYLSPMAQSLFRKDSTSTDHDAVRKVSPIPGTNRHCLQTAGRRSVVTMLVLSVTYIVCYIPVLSLLIARIMHTQFVYNLDDTQYIVYKFFLRSYFIKFAANPFIYFVCDSRFRRICKRLCSSCFVRCREEESA